MRFLGSDFQINKDISAGNGILGSQILPRVAGLSSGGFVVVFQSDRDGLSSNEDVNFSLFTADGVAGVFGFFVLNSNQTQPAVSALPDGSFGIVFTNALHADTSVDTNPNNITYVHDAVNGTLVTVGDFDAGTGFDSLLNPAIALLSDGRQVVAFERTFSSTDHDIFLNVVSADGTSTLRTGLSAANALNVANDSNDDADPAVASAGNTALVVYQEQTEPTLIISPNIVARLFNAATNSLGAQFTIADHTAELHNPKVAALDDHRYIIVYDDFGDVFGKIFDATGGQQSAEFQIDNGSDFSFDPAVAVTADGGFIVSRDRVSGGFSDILARRYNSDGAAMGQEFTVNRLTDGPQEVSSVAVNGANAFFAWTDLQSRSGDTHPDSVRGQVMTLTTPPDFNDNGISDIFWRSDAGALFSWDMNKTGVINSGPNVTFNGAAIQPDASFGIAAISDFNGDGRADILWRNTSGFTALWTMKGSVIQSSSFLTSGGVAVNPDPSFSVAGVGDFDGDGQSDILWRNTNGALIVWTMNGPVIQSSSFVTFLGNTVSPDASFTVAGIGDFNGDGKSDILWRSTTTGEVALWQMDGSVIAGSTDATFNGVAIRPDASFSIAAVGDFNADGNADILWRNTSGLLVEWLMNGSTITSSGVLTSNGVAVPPDASWHVVEIGDFNGDARTDILWRSDSGALAEWLMKGTTIVSSVAPNIGGTAVTPDASFHTQAKPTDFA
jgi:FG-GAP-like repeat